MDTLSYILKKFNFENYSGKYPLEIPDFGRNNLAQLFREVEFKVGVEVGVESGEYSEVLCKANPEGKLYCIDPWKSYRGYRDHVNQEKIDGFYATTKERMAKYNCELIKKTSMDAIKDFKDGSIDFVYIDGNHIYDYVVNDITQWSRKVRAGGIVSGHDYRSDKRPTANHTPEAVNGFVSSYNIKPWFLLGLKSMDPGFVRDESRSWMWVKGL